MDRIAAASATERQDLFGEAANQLGMNAAIVEKDFWVCWILKHLFMEPALKEHLVFKGGTTLSKIFHLIERFSEDIDLILDWRLLGYGTAEGTDPYRTIQSRTKQNQYNEEINEKAADYIRETLLGQLKQIFLPVVGLTASIEETDPHTVEIQYPAAFKASYIRPEVRLEIGPLASWVPSSQGTIRPYAAEPFPKAFTEPDCIVVATAAERTFWEKATILHQEAHRPGTIPTRYSRHYYDLYKLAGSPIKKAALADPALLNAVVEFKQRFYYSSWAHYELAVPGSFRLIPTERQLTALERDYREMRDMFYREPPEFAEVIRVLKALEDEINGESDRAKEATRQE